MTQNKLIGVTPFNKFMFRTCYYHHLLACYDYYGADQDLLLSNFIALYAPGAKGGFFKSYCVYDRRQLACLSGVKDVKLDEPASVTDTLIQYLDAGIPVILSMDNYYLPHRKDYYKKQHILHYILVYGYDREEEKFICLEHMFKNSYRYNEERISFAAAERAHKGSLAIKGAHGRTFVAVMPKKKKAVELSGSKKESLKRRIEESRRFKNDMLDNMLKQLREGMYERLMELSAPIMYYRNAFCARAYSAGIEQRKEKELLEKAIDDMTYISGTIIKAYGMKGISEDELVKFKKRVESIKETEEMLHDGLLRKYC